MPAAEIAIAESQEYTGKSFDLSAYLARSKQLDVSDLDWGSVPRHPVDPGELRCLVYMMDIEAHTLCYLRDVLNAGAAADPEIADFLGCWLYEESYHGRAIERFLRAAGAEQPAGICGRHAPSLAERIEHLATRAISGLCGRHFLTVHMTWGAIQEHTTLFGYTQLARKTRNPVLAELLRRIARDESRHFGFYYYKAFQGLKDSPFARRLAAFLLRSFWTPVGEGVKPRSDTDFLMNYIFDGTEGEDAVRRIDYTMSRLPGLSWFDLLSKRRRAAMARR